MILLLLALLSPIYALKAVNFEDRRVYEFDEISQPPSRVERIWMRVTKATTDGSSDPVVVHILRLQWTLPRYWNDDGSNRSFGVICEAEDVKNNETFSLLDVSVSSDITAVHERFILPPVSLSLICAVRPQNSKGLQEEWKFSKVFLVDGPEKEDGSSVGLNLETTKEPRIPLQSTMTMNLSKEETEPQLSKETIRELLKTATLTEIPFPKMEPRKTIHLTRMETESTEATKTTSDGTTTTTTTMKATEVTQNSASEVNNSDDSLLFLRGLTINPSELPVEEDQQLALPFSSNAFGSDEGLRLAPTGRLAPEVESDYDALEQRIREAIGGAHERVLK